MSTRWLSEAANPAFAILLVGQSISLGLMMVRHCLLTIYSHQLVTDHLADPISAAYLTVIAR